MLIRTRECYCGHDIAPDPLVASWIWLDRIEASVEGMEGKEKKKIYCKLCTNFVPKSFHMTFIYLCILFIYLHQTVA